MRPISTMIFKGRFSHHLRAKSRINSWTILMRWQSTFTISDKSLVSPQLVLERRPVPEEKRLVRYRVVDMMKGPLLGRVSLKSAIASRRKCSMKKWLKRLKRLIRI